MWRGNSRREYARRMQRRKHMTAMNEMPADKLCASGDGIRCYHLGSYRFVAVTPSGAVVERRSMYAAVAAAYRV